MRKSEDSSDVFASVTCYAGKGGIAGPQSGGITGGAGGNQPKTTDLMSSLWTLKSDAGMSGGLATAGTTAQGNERQGGSFGSTSTCLTTY